jgi:flavin reductase (DIM6/NTAB) family NADH-FMN oxidoreductase RutF
LEDFMKRRLGPTERLYPMPTPLVVAGSGDRLGIMAVAWVAIAGSTPSSVVMSVRSTRHTLALIRETGEFTLNVPNVALAEAVDYCGIASGRNTDKFADTGLTPLASAVVATPIVEQCPLNLECRVMSEVPNGEYVLVIGEIVETHVDEDLVDDAGRLDVDRLDPLVYIPGNREYRGLGPKLADAFKIGRGVRPQE